MKEAGVTKAEMARRMNTSRSHLDRLLDPDRTRELADQMRAAGLPL